MVASIQDSTERGGNAEAIIERPRYTKPFSELAEIYHVTPRGLRKWICRGRLANDPPPLDNPALMPDWWTRHYRIRVPENLLLAAAVCLASIPTADEVQNAPSFATALDDARKNVVVCKTELAASRAAGNVHSIASCNRSYGDALDILVKCERLSFEMRLKGGEFFSRADIEREVAYIAERVRYVLEMFAMNIDKRLADAPGELRERVKSAVRDETEKVFALLYEMRKLADQSPESHLGAANCPASF